MTKDIFSGTRALPTTGSIERLAQHFFYEESTDEWSLPRSWPVPIPAARLNKCSAVPENGLDKQDLALRFAVHCGDGKLEGPYGSGMRDQLAAALPMLHAAAAACLKVKGQTRFGSLD